MLKKFLLLGSLITLLLLGVVATQIYNDYVAFLNEPITVAPASTTYTVQRGKSFKELANDLHAQGIIREPRYLIVYARLAKVSHRIKAGQYRLAIDMTPRTMIDHFIAGKTAQYSLTILEGWNFRQMMQVIRAHPQLTQTLAPELDGSQIMQTLGLADQHPEGLFYPDTYHFPIRTTDVDFLLRAYQIMQQKLAAAWVGRAPDTPLQTPYEALILASIIEKETALAQERSLIAGVFVRRLIKGMRLQTDPTVIYGMGELFDGNIRRKDLRKDTPYNTYQRKGLPPTPIAMPSEAAIVAALNPAEGKALYFVARGDGSHYFSATLDEHNAAVRKYQLKKK